MAGRPVIIGAQAWEKPSYIAVSFSEEGWARRRETKRVSLMTPPRPGFCFMTLLCFCFALFTTPCAYSSPFHAICFSLTFTWSQSMGKVCVVACLVYCLFHHAGALFCGCVT
ncbi:hypothetical protein VTJ04DRAFT_192 [Mycothermus thermophilus]|uniref:uncharacterized protein n=1 Tax=Humicola insolens TaxID=85995 RepID=UPI00374498E4